MNFIIIAVLLVNLVSLVISTSTCKLGYTYYDAQIVGHTVEQSECETCMNYILIGGKCQNSCDSQLVCTLLGKSECYVSSLVLQYESNICVKGTDLRTFGTVEFAELNVAKEYPINSNVTICAQNEDCYLETLTSSATKIVIGMSSFVIVLFVTFINFQ